MKSMIVAGCIVSASLGVAQASVPAAPPGAGQGADLRATDPEPTRLAQSDSETAAQLSVLKQQYKAKPDTSYQDQMADMDRQIAALTGSWFSPSPRPRSTGGFWRWRTNSACRSSSACRAACGCRARANC